VSSFSWAIVRVSSHDLAHRLASCPYAAAVAGDKMARMRHLIWRIVPLKRPSCSLVIINDKALRGRIMKLMNAVKFVPSAASAARGDAIMWLLSNDTQLSTIAKAESCSQPTTAADIDR
jgi:hypothetical protein